MTKGIKVLEVVEVLGGTKVYLMVDGEIVTSYGVTAREAVEAIKKEEVV